MSGIVEDWFGPAFTQLHPLLQELHRRGGVLSGPLDVRYGRGLSGWLGRRLARRLGITSNGESNRLEVTIFSDERALHWNRRFNACSEFKSTFIPSGRFPRGHWVEANGGIRLRLAVEIMNRGWHWRHIATHLHGIPVPRLLAPRTRAYKEIDGDCYRFHVEIGLPILGLLLAYGGRLNLRSSSSLG
jgi:hypothetical protein